MKKLTAIILAAVMVFSMATTALAASVTPEFSTTAVKAGQDVTVTLTLDAAIENVVSLDYRLYFDANLFTLKSSENGNAHSAMQISNLKTDTKGTSYMVSFVDTTSEGQTIAAGTLYTLTFTAKADMTEEQSAAFELVSKGVYDPSFSKIDVPVSNASISVTVEPAAVAVTGITLDKTALELTVEETAILTATVDPENATDKTVTWTSSDETIATVADGVVTAVAAGNATITAKAGDQEASCTVTVAPVVSAYTVAMGADVETVVGETISIPVTVGYTDDTVKNYNAFDMTFTYDPAVLTLASTTIEGMTVTVDGGTVHVQRYGSDLSVGGTALTLTFTAIDVGEADVELTSAKVDISDSALTNDAPDASVIDSKTLVTVAGYTVNLPIDFKGEPTVAPGTDYTFEAKDKNYNYDVTAKIGDDEIDVTDNGDGTFTIPAEEITGNIVITTEKTGKLFNVTLGDDMTGETSAQYMTPYTATLTKEAGYGYQITVTIGGEAYTGFTYDAATGVVTIPGEAIVGAIGFDSGKKAGEFDVTFEGNHAADAEGEAVAEGGRAYSFKLNKVDGYTYEITATMGGEKVELTEAEGTYTIAKVTGNIVITVEGTSDLKVEVKEYVTLNGKTMFLVTATQTLADDEALSYDGNVMFWSEQYAAWAYLVMTDGVLTDEEAKAEITVSKAEFTALEQTYNVNETTNDTVDINDAQLVFDMYNNEYQDFYNATMQKFLKADVNGDKAINVHDAAAIVAEIVRTK